MNQNAIESLLLHELLDIHDAEKQLHKALPSMAQAAHDPELKAAIGRHLEDTSRHVEQLDAILKELGNPTERKTCHAMKALIEEATAQTKLQGPPGVIDAAMIGAAQRIEHYEIAAYGCARALAEFAGKNDIARKLQQVLDNEDQQDERLTEVAEEDVNARASQVYAAAGSSSATPGW